MPAYDVAVIGCGAIGSAALWHSTSRGLKAIGLDRFSPPHDQGSSHGESRIIRENYWEDPAYVPLVHRAYDLWHDLEMLTGQELLVPSGALLMGVPDGEVIPGARQASRTHGPDLESLDAHVVDSRFAPFRLPDGLEAVYEPRGGALRPEACIDAHLEVARQAGAHVRTGVTVTGWSKQGAGYQVTSDGGTVQAKRIIVAGGAWLPKLVPLLAAGLHVERQVLVWYDPPCPMPPGDYPVFACEDKAGHLFYGFPDLGNGIKVAVHHDGEDADPDVPRRPATDDEVAGLTRRLEAILPGVGRVRRAETCMYTNTPDMHFVIDRLPDHPDVIVAGGGSGHAFKFSAALGEAAASLAADERPPTDLSPFAVERLLG